jgi:alkylresorcinol/alkylpyrone synthase
MTPLDERLRHASARSQERVHRSRVRKLERVWGRLAPSSPPRIAALAVDSSTDRHTQRDVLRALGLEGDEFAERIFARCGVERRQIKLDPEFLALNIQGRTERVEDELFERAVQTISRLGVDPGQIGAVFTSSLWSLGCPSLAHRLVEHLEMDPATDKYHITGVGCASAVPLLRLAGQTLQAAPHRQVLVVAAESMSSIMMPGSAEDPRAKTVGSAIFGDGCAATLLSGDPVAPGPLILASQVHHIAGTLDSVSVTASPGDSYLQLARELPDLAAAGLGELLERFLRANRLDRADIDHWVVHPGGRRIIESVRDALALSDEDVATSWQALADNGNVGTPAIFYVLNSTMERRPAAGELGVAVTIGPGVTAGLMLLQW